MNVDETLGIEEAAALLRADAATVMQYARRGELPGTRIGKSWVFLREDILSFLRSQINRDTQERLAKRSTLPITGVFVGTAVKSRRRVLPDLSSLLPPKKN